MTIEKQVVTGRRREH